MNEDKTKNEEKELKRLLEAHVLVYKNKHGKTPTLEDLTSMISGDGEKEASAAPSPVASKEVNSGSPVQEVKSEPTSKDEGLKKEDPIAPGSHATGLQKETTVNEEGEIEPKILSMKCYYGMKDLKDGAKEPDQNKILFYEHPNEGRVYSVEDQGWLPSRPSVLDHLPHRNLNFDERDIVAAIAHGVMDDEDYDSLDKSGMITETPKRLWDLGKKLKNQVADLQSLNKSIEEPEDEEMEFEDDVEESESDSVAKKMMELAVGSGVGGSIGFSETAELGSNTFDEIMNAAMSRAMTGMEDIIREIVQEEIQKLLEEPEQSEDGDFSEEIPHDDNFEIEDDSDELE